MERLAEIRMGVGKWFQRVHLNDTTFTQFYFRATHIDNPID